MINIPLKFNYTINEIKSIEKDIIKNNEIWLKNIRKNKNITPNDFLKSYIYKDEKFNYIIDVIRFLKYVSSDIKIKDACNEFDIKIKKYFSDFYNSVDNYKLFLILKKVKNDKDNCKKLIKNIFRSFIYNGVLLNTKNRNKLVKINNQLLIEQNKFSDNIMENMQYLKFNKDELKGIDEQILKDHQKNNYYIFDTSYPDKNTIMKYCEVRETRKKMNNTFNSIAKDNQNILKNIIKNRYERSLLFGFKNSVQYFFSENRIAKEKDINHILSKLIPKLKQKLNDDCRKLMKVSNQKILYEYDIAYYGNIYKEKYLNCDDKIIKNYFPSNYTLLKILNIYSDLFGVQIKLIKEDRSKYWHKDVDLYVITENENILGYIYLDLYPREGKYSHAATFDLQNTYKDINDKRIIPVTAIVCNFSKPEDGNKYSLLTFSEIVTFCHELGHGFHNILSNVKYGSLSGISVENDFAEAPSQFFENWCYQKEFLKKISNHHLTNKKLPNNIIDKIIKNRDYMNSLNYLTQILYIKYDLNIHKQEKITEKYLHEKWFKILKDLLPFQFDKNTYPHCRFDHLMDYACNYYGYLFSLIYAYDAFSIFEKEGIFNKKVGYRFRKEILEKGGTIKAINMLENFLQRKKSEKHFYKIFK